jgi:hypothetical protein
MSCLSFFPVGELLPLGEQVEQPLQLGGAGLQVDGELGAGLCRAAVQRVQQLAVVASSDRSRRLLEGRRVRTRPLIFRACLRR